MDFEEKAEGELMKKKRYTEHTTKQCAGCVKEADGFCRVLTQPRYFYDNYGKCFSRSTDPRFFEKVKQEVEFYKKGVSYED